MKERFEQLAEEAKLLLSLDQQFGWRVIGGTDEHLEKFAEFIVREMLDIFDKRAEPGTGFYEPHEPAELIRHRFGIE